MKLEEFVERPLRVAAALNAGECGGSHAEAYILIGAVISSVASFLWPGERIDKRRFVETWVRFGDAAAKRVSVPLLLNTLQASRRLGVQRPEGETLRRSRPRCFGPGYDVRVLVDDDVDADEAALFAECPTLGRTMLRRHTYPVVFYEDVRSALVHEYELDERVSSWPMAPRSAKVSYFNMQGIRRIHFHVDWLIELARGLARGADELLVGGHPSKPTCWWLDEP
jgi:hypothetical protein